MNREIKFRVWDIENKRMFLPNSNISIENPDDFNYPTLNQEFDTSFVKLGVYERFPNKYWFSNNCIIQQFTGLKDKNNKEIYEGDIFRLNNINISSYNFRSDVFEVKYITEHGQYVLFGGNGNWYDLQKYFTDKGEVIGNILENSNLLGKIYGY